MVELLIDTGTLEAALVWCEAALAHTGAAQDTENAGAQRHSLHLSRSFLHEELGMEPDAQDLAAEAVAQQELDEFGRLLRETVQSLPGGRQLLPDDDGPYDGIVLRWSRAEFPAVRARWPETTEAYTDDYDTYAARLQNEARAYSDAGAVHVRLVTADLADYGTYAQRTGRDPAAPETRQAYGPWRAETTPEAAVLWPPPRNGPCWCESGKKFKKCCGTPARN
jgi:hypothetical protein